jgi:hypothetical protein
MRSGLITLLVAFWTLGSWAEAPNIIDEGYCSRFS